ncbi:hypothetical protein A1O1_02635 [Capronia coronata CBS 617.96]|uniref:Uncharacterized protein n=1 Tax=Capronia coronata CBS 617.96 TaxID=1182541 RepID=W9YMT7_9EURO|nr:uncharacterized protein A1O1_02635 [Capronia coronata CBS 617.96]EXJ94242.1 hypothetical protein A1O1_02635 [Capronia coronata CBS 617.96]
MSLTSGGDDAMLDSVRLTPQPNDDSSATLQRDLIALYAEILLSRAHLAFFITALDDTEAQQDSLHQGKAALEEAERLCLSEKPVNKHLLAKCWYVRGFLADIFGEDADAKRHFTQAVGLDESYKSLQRVHGHLQRIEDTEELNEMWDAASSKGKARELDTGSPGMVDAQELSDMWGTTSSFGRHERPPRLNGNTNSRLPGSSSPKSGRHSVLFRQLMQDVSRTPSHTVPRDASNVSPAPIESSTAGSPRSASSGRLDMDGILERLKNTPAQIRKVSVPSKDPPGLDRIRPTKNDPANDRMLAAELEIAAYDYRKRKDAMQGWKAAREKRGLKVTKTARRASGEETLLSDTPGVSELDTTDNPRPPTAPPKLSLDIRAERRQSVSYAASPTSPSPLRHAFAADDVVDVPSTQAREGRD